MHLPSLNELAKLDATPRVHPNGFIQLDLDERRRLHVWHPRLPYRQRTYHPIHDHVFGFKSRVFSGRLVNVNYEIERNPASGRFFLWQAVSTSGEESRLVQILCKPVDMAPTSVQVVWPGSTYAIEPYTFHENLANEPTLTVIEKDGPTTHQDAESRPRVAVPVGVEPDNDFCRGTVDADLLWELIAEAMP